MTDSREDRIKEAADKYKRGIITKAEFRYACEVAIYGMSWEQHQLREAAIDRLLADEVAEDRAYAIDIVNERGWFPKEDHPYVMPREERG